jgi:hypothetical protein
MDIVTLMTKVSKQDRTEADAFYAALETAGLPFKQSNDLEGACLNWINQVAEKAFEIGRKEARA